MFEKLKYRSNSRNYFDLTETPNFSLTLVQSTLLAFFLLLEPMWNNTPGSA